MNKAIGAAVVGVSVDDVESHAKFASKYKLPFTLLSDADKTVNKAYQVLRNYKLFKIASRQSFLINPQGVIVKHYDKVDPDKHSEEVLKALKQLMAKQSSFHWFSGSRHLPRLGRSRYYPAIYPLNTAF